MEKPEQSSTNTLNWLKMTFQELLGTPFVKPQDDFFDLGADSLTVIKLFSRLEHKFGKDKISLDQLFEQSRLDQLADLLGPS